MKPLIIIFVLAVLGSVLYIHFWAKNTVVPSNYTVSKLCPDGISAKEYVSADGKKTIKKECPKEEFIVTTTEWPCDLETEKCP